MGDGHLGLVLRHVRGLIAGRAGDTEDERLLERFVSRRDESAFAALVQRHGPMVLGLCRRLLGHEQDAEDVFQATFLVLAHKAGSIHKGNSVGAWLHGVAYRIARRIRAGAARPLPDRGDPWTTSFDPSEAACRAELRAVLDEALSGLPEKYRAPLVLCYLEGKTSVEAAQELGRPVGSMSRHLERGRELLRRELAGRGVLLPGGLLASLLAAEAAAAALPAARKVAALAAGSVEAGRAALLAEGVLQAAPWARLKVVVLLLGLGLTGVGTGLLAQRAASGQHRTEPAPALDALLRDLSSSSFRVRQQAEKQLRALAPARLPELRAALDRERDLEVRLRLARIIDELEMRDFRHRYGLRGDRIARYRFGPFEPGPVQVDILVPETATWADGVYFVRLVSNRGKQPVEVTWTDSSGDTWGEADVTIASTDPMRGSSGWWLRWPGERLAPGETRAVIHHVNSWHANIRTDPVLGLDLRARLRQGERRGQLRVSQKPGWRIHLRPATAKEDAAAVREVAELAARTLKPNERGRLGYLINQPQRPQNRLSPPQLRAGYEGQRPQDAYVAGMFLDSLLQKAPEKDVLAYAASRVRAGDTLPLGRCGRLLPRDLAPVVVGSLRSKDARSRAAALEYLGSLGYREVAARVADLLADPDPLVRETALGAVQKLKVPCAAKVARLLADNVWHLRRDAAQTLAALGAREQLPALRQALRANTNPEVITAIVRALGPLRGDPKDVKEFLTSRNPSLRAAAIGTLGDLGARGEADRIAKFLASEYGSDQSAAAYALGRLRSRKHVGLLARKAETHEALAMTVVHALADIGGEEAVAALRGFALDRPINFDRGLARTEAVRALARALPPGKRMQELTTILRSGKAHPSARAEAVRQLGPLGRQAARVLREVVADKDVGLVAMCELVRYSAPRRFAARPSFPAPLKNQAPLSELSTRLGFPVRIRVPGLEQVQVPLLADRVTLADVFFELAGLREGIGVILTDTELRVVPRARAADFYRRLSLD